MTVIDPEHFGHAKAVIAKLIGRATDIINDIEETVRDRARLEQEAAEREAVIDQLNGAIAERDKRIGQLETRNTILAEDIVRLESELAAPTAILDNVRTLPAAPATTTTRAA